MEWLGPNDLTREFSLLEYFISINGNSTSKGQPIGLSLLFANTHNCIRVWPPFSAILEHIAFPSGEMAMGKSPLISNNSFCRSLPSSIFQDRTQSSALAENKVFSSSGNPNQKTLGTEEP